MFRRTKRRIVIGLLAAALAGGGAAVNRDAIYEKTGIDVDFLNLRGVEKIKDAEKIMAKYSIKPEDMQKILSSKWAEAMEILTKYNVNPAHIAQLVLTDVGNHSWMFSAYCICKYEKRKEKIIWKK